MLKLHILPSGQQALSHQMYTGVSAPQQQQQPGVSHSSQFPPATRPQVTQQVHISTIYHVIMSQGCCVSY